MSKQKRYRLKDSDRSGFTFKEIELVKDKGNLVGPGEFDAPPPSNLSTGGEGEMDRSGIRANWESYDAVNERPVQNLGPGGLPNGIVFPTVPDPQGKSDPNNAWVYITGNAINAPNLINPQITPGRHQSIITVQCVSNNLILKDSNGLALRTSIFRMLSGSIINLIYNATDNLWHETSRSHVDGRFV